MRSGCGKGSAIGRRSAGCCRPWRFKYACCDSNKGGLSGSPSHRGMPKSCSGTMSSASCSGFPLPRRSRRVLISRGAYTVAAHRPSSAGASRGASNFHQQEGRVPGLVWIQRARIAARCSRHSGSIASWLLMSSAMNGLPSGRQRFVVERGPKCRVNLCTLHAKSASGHRA